MAGPGAGDSELISRTLPIEQKLFYFDLKDNPRGRCLKISEKAGGSRSTIIVPLAGVVWFVDLFNYYSNGEDTELASKELQLDTKVFYFDVGENPRGRFLKVSEASHQRSRSTIIVPAGQNNDQGWAAFRNVLVEIHEASLNLPPPTTGFHPQSTIAPVVPVPQQSAPVAPVQAISDPKLTQSIPNNPDVGSSAGASAAVVASGDGSTSRIVRADPKKFFFDFGSNARGHFLKISEVLGPDRSSIIIPANVLEQVHEVIGSFVDMAKAHSGSGAANVRTVNSTKRRADI